MAKHSQQPSNDLPAFDSSAFSFRLFAELAARCPQENIFVSPLSVAAALLLTAVGADGATRTAIVETLGIREPQLNHANQQLAGLLQELERPEHRFRLAMATSLWSHLSAEPSAAFVHYATKLHRAHVASVDFHQPATLDRINQWAAEHTAGRITQAVDAVNEETVMLLLNAVTFKGLWSEPFDLSLTREGSFYLAGGAEQRLPMMAMIQEQSLSYFQDQQVQIVRLPYGQGRIAMEIVLPAPEVDLASFARSLTNVQWQHWQSQMKAREGNVRLPRFSCKFKRSLRDVLAALGMERAFKPDQARFGYLTSAPVWIDDIRHTTTLLVNEQGTEASAVNETLISLGLADGPFEMVVDRPFFCAISDQRSGVLLFMGLIVDPETA